MKTFSMLPRFGNFLSNGIVADEFRRAEVEPVLAAGEDIVFDFSGITNVTTSFANALIATLLARQPEAFARGVRFRNCDVAVQVLLRGAIAVGRRESALCAA